MKILLVEDDLHKAQHIRDHIKNSYGEKITIKTARSYQTGLHAVMTESYDTILLDMSLPNYDISASEDGYHFDAFAGRNILSEMKRKNIVSNVVIITQYDTLGEGEDRMTLDELREQLSNMFPGLYKGAVYYSSGETNWKDALIAQINAL